MPGIEFTIRSSNSVKVEIYEYRWVEDGKLSVVMPTLIREIELKPQLESTANAWGIRVKEADDA